MVEKSRIKEPPTQKNLYIRHFLHWPITLKFQMNMQNKKFLPWEYVWASSWENLFMPYANNKSADQPAHPHSLISAFVIHCLDSIISLVSIFAISLLSLASVAEQAVLSLTCSELPKVRFFQDVSHVNCTHFREHKRYFGIWFLLKIQL